MLIDKITEGYVKQTYDTDKQTWTAQEFVAGNPVTYEVEGGEIDSEDFAERCLEGEEPYLPFDMVQPNEEHYGKAIDEIVADLKEQDEDAREGILSMTIGGFEHDIRSKLN
jgi:hypothetical protein